MQDVYRELIDALSETPQQLVALAPEAAGAPRSNEHWGLAEIVAHLVDVERVYRGRIQAILAREGAYLRRFDPDRAAREHDYASKDLHTVLDEFAHERGETLSLLMNLALKDWERTGIHDEFGEVSVEDLVERLVDHDAAHLRQARGES